MSDSIDAPSQRFARWMVRAIDLARAAALAGEVPVGAVVIGSDGALLGEGANDRESRTDPFGHAEVAALRSAAARTGSWRMPGATLVVTLEPCVMCVGAAVQAKVERIVLGAWDAKAGACGSVWDLARSPRAAHRVEVTGGVREHECAEMLKDFFEARRLR